MSTYILMKILESAPHRYDRGIRLLTWGRLARAYERLAAYIKEGQKVLDLGCGTGALTLRAARRGARVKAIDVNAEMLAVARERVAAAGLAGRVELAEAGVAELGAEGGESYDVVTSGLCFSELSADELRYTLREVNRILKAGGLLLVADEVRPKRFWKRVFVLLLRLPLAAITYLLTQTTTTAVKDLRVRIGEAGFVVVSSRSSRTEDFVEVVARKGGTAPE